MIQLKIIGYENQMPGTLRKKKTFRYHKEAGKKATWFAEVKNFSGNRGII